MTVAETQIKHRRWPLSGAAVLALVISALVLLPVAAIVWMALNPVENVWPHLWATTLPRYVSNTLWLLVSVGLLSALIGSSTAWLVTVYRFPGSRWLQYALFAPLAIPGYVGAYALTDFLEFAGPVQTGLRQAFGWQSAADYWFFEIRSRGMASVVLASVLYPYVYLLTRAALREQSGAIYDVARALGAGGLSLFWRVGLPLVRPAVAVGASIAMMETVADFGVVDFFAVQTLTTGIFTVWLEQSNAGAAAQIALCAVGLILLLISVERTSRRRMRFHQSGRQVRKLVPQVLSGRSRWLALAWCLLPISIGFLLPVAVMAGHAFSSLAAWSDPELVRALVRTVLVALAVALLATGAGVLLVYSLRQSHRQWPRLLLPVAGIGYAMPGAVLGLGVLIPFAAIDHAFADAVLAITGSDPGLLLTGSATAIVFACAVRFFMIAQGAMDGAMGRITPSVSYAARSLGQSPAGTLRKILLPLIRPSIGTALLLIFVDTAKELPMTLLLRPFHFDTLATHVYERASLENIAGAAPASLIISLVGLAAVALIIRSNR